MEMTIRPERSGDEGAIAALTRAAFHDAAHSSHTEQFIVAALRRAGALSLSLVAEDDGQLLGHVALSPVTLSCGASGWYGLGPISVRPDRQGQGIGRRLMEAAIAWLEAQGAQGCVLLGEPAYYGRFGFENYPELVLPGVPPEYFQALALAGAVPTGEVSYHPAFSATG
ncbi:N-acetyltransferase [Gallaecimonas sp. GXIMD4217]|uniref:GNAT family N-acetyltransferase n=2 Tax=Gallaecimonas sp. GXIMD4217 TaxID=3131927 RepID=UPI00311B3096